MRSRAAVAQLEQLLLGGGQRPPGVAPSSASSSIHQRRTSSPCVRSSCWGGGSTGRVTADGERVQLGAGLPRRELSHLGGQRSGGVAGLERRRRRGSRSRSSCAGAAGVRGRSARPGAPPARRGSARGRGTGCRADTAAVGRGDQHHPAGSQHPRELCDHLPAALPTCSITSKHVTRSNEASANGRAVTSPTCELDVRRRRSAPRPRATASASTSTPVQRAAPARRHDRGAVAGPAAGVEDRPAGCRPGGPVVAAEVLGLDHLPAQAVGLEPLDGSVLGCSGRG